MEYKIIRSSRKTVGLYITNDAKLEVRAPEKISKEAIQRIVDEKLAWIEKHIELKKRQISTKNTFVLDYGSKILLCGIEYPVTESEGIGGFDGEHFNIEKGLGSEQIKNAIIKIYKKLAAEMIIPKVREYSSLMNVKSTAVHINSAKTRWGSCSGKNSLNFSWRLILGCEKVINYVVVHELSHIIYHDHSKDFWKTVETFMPDYRLREQELKKLSKLLSEQNW